jgi:ribosomal-protein-alanine N-acetyltransferase
MFDVREMTEADLAAVLEIETACFGAPWTRAMFQDELRHSLSWLRVVVDEKSERVAGFIVARHYGDVWHVMDLAVSPSRRGLGLGGRLLDGLLGHTPREVPVVLEVREGNTGAIALYRSRGFRDSGRRPHYYVDTGEAALLMVFGPEMAW